MHEISLVHNLLEQLTALALENNRKRVTKVTMEIGPCSGVVVDSFQFGFDILTEHNQLTRGAKLVIHIPQALYRCTQCGHEIKTNKERPRSCPECDEHLLMPEGGDDLILKQVEME